MRIVRWFFGLLVLAGLAFAAAYYYAGTLDGPAITINQPSVIGQGGTLDVTVDAPGGELSALNIQIEQKGRTFPVLDHRVGPCRCRGHERRSRPHHETNRQEDAAGSGKRTCNTEGQRVTARFPEAASGVI